MAQILIEASTEKEKMTPNIDTKSVTFDFKLHGELVEDLRLEMTIRFSGKR